MIRKTTEFHTQNFVEAYPDGVEGHYWHRHRHYVIARALSRLDGGRMLEVGCGRGVVVRDLRARGFDCDGVELAPVTPMPGAERFVQGGVEATELLETRRAEYQIIGLFDVLEHLSEPYGFITNLVRGFPNLKHLLFTVPARMELWSNYEEHYGHFRRYTLESLNDVFACCHLNPLEARYFFRSLYLPCRLLLLARRARAVRHRAPVGFLPLHGLIAWLLKLEFHLVPPRVPGTSIIASCAVQF